MDQRFFHKTAVPICNCMFACIHEAFYCLLVLCQFCLWRCAGWICISMITWWREIFRHLLRLSWMNAKCHLIQLVCFMLPPAVRRWLFSHNKIMLMTFCLTAASCWGGCCSYWCTWWFSVWMTVSLLGYPCRLYQWGAFRSGSSYIEVNSDVPTLGGISYNSISNGFYNLCKLAQKQSF